MGTEASRSTIVQTQAQHKQGSNVRIPPLQLLPPRPIVTITKSSDNDAEEAEQLKSNMTTQLDKAQESLLLYDDGKTELLPPPSPDRHSEVGIDAEALRDDACVVLSGQRFGDPQFA